MFNLNHNVKQDGDDDDVYLQHDVNYNGGDIDDYLQHDVNDEGDNDDCFANSHPAPKAKHTSQYCHQLLNWPDNLRIKLVRDYNLLVCLSKENDPRYEIRSSKGT